MDYGKRREKVEFIDVKKDAAGMKAFLALSGGDRRVPLIDDGGQITVGYGGT